MVRAPLLVWALVAGPVIGVIAAGYIRLIGWVSYYRITGRRALFAMMGAAMQAPLASLALVLELTHSGFQIMVPMLAATGRRDRRRPLHRRVFHLFRPAASAARRATAAARCGRPYHCGRWHRRPGHRSDGPWRARNAEDRDAVPLTVSTPRRTAITGQNGINLG